MVSIRHTTPAPSTGVIPRSAYNEDHTVPVATQAEAEAGSATDKVMTPLRTAQAIAALASGGGGGSSSWGGITGTLSAQTDLQNALNLKSNIASPAFTGSPSAPTPAGGTNSTQLATTAFVQAALTALIGTSPALLDTLGEISDALGDDPNFAATITAALAGKQPLDATLTALAGLVGGADKLPYFTGTDVLAQADLTAFGRTLIALADYAALRTGLNAAQAGANTDITSLRQSTLVSETGVALAASLGFRGLPASAQTKGATITLALSDIAKKVRNTLGGWAIPANATLAFPDDIQVILYNESDLPQTVTIGGGDTLRLAGGTTTGTRTVVPRGYCVLHKEAPTEWVAQGNIA